MKKVNVFLLVFAIQAIFGLILIQNKYIFLFYSVFLPIFSFVIANLIEKNKDK